MRGSAPVQPSTARIATSSAVIATYSTMNRLAVSRIVVASGSSGPGISALNSAWRPPTRRRGSTARNSTMIPTPPIQTVNWRHISIERDPDPGGRAPGGEERPHRLAVPDRDGEREQEREAEVLDERSDEVQRAAD